jgi:hypothetical protein
MKAKVNGSVRKCWVGIRVGCGGDEMARISDGSDTAAAEIKYGGRGRSVFREWV